MRESQHERQAHEHVELVGVAHGRQHAVEQRLDVGRPEAPRRADVAGGDRDEPQHQPGDQVATVRHVAPRESDETERQHEHAVEDEQPVGDQEASGVGPEVDVRHPVGRAAQRVEDGRRERRGRGGLDVVEEGRAVAAQQQERQDPPAGHGQHERRPPQQQRPTSRPARPDEQEPARERHDREGGDRVDAADRAHGEGAERRVPARVATASAEDEREDHPGGHRRRPHLDGRRPQHRQHARRQREGERRDDARGVRADAEGLGQLHHPDERHHEHHGPPRTLHDPRGQLREVTQPEERAHREQVPVRLVLHLTERARRVPERQRPAQEAPRVDREVELGVGDDPTGGLGERERHEHRGPRDQARASATVPPQRLRSTIARFHVTTSRTTGTRSTHHAQRGR